MQCIGDNIVVTIIQEHILVHIAIQYTHLARLIDDAVSFNGKTYNQHADIVADDNVDDLVGSCR